MHTGPARQENPAAPALFLRGGLTRLRLAILLSGVSPVIPRGNAASQGRGDTRCEKGGGPQMRRAESVNAAPDFFQLSGRHVEVY